MPNRSLSYKVEFDTRSAVRDLQRLTREGARAGEDIADGFDKTETAGTNALRALTRQLDALETTAKGTAKAAEAIGRELGDGFDTSKVSSFVADLNRIGVGFDEIEQKAEEFAAVLRRADDTDLSGVRGELDQVGTGLDRVRTNGDQSRSVLANMAGNAAQDLGQLGGVVGTLGVAVGQLGEYAVDGNIALANLAKVAGPMAGLAAAGLLVNKVVGDMAKVSEANAERLELFADAARDGRDAFTDLREQVAATGDLTFINERGLFGLRDSVEDLVPDLAALGLTFEHFQQIVTDPAARQRWQETLDTWVNTRGILDPATQALGNVIEAAEQYADTAETVAADQTELLGVLGETPPTLDDVAEALAAAGARATDMDAAMVDAGEALDEFNRSAGDAEQRASAFAAGLDAINASSELSLSGRIIAASDAVDEFGQALRDARDAGVDFAGADLIPDTWEEVRGLSDAARPLVDAFAGARDAIQTELAAAFELGGRPAFDRALAQIRTSYVRTLADAGIEGGQEFDEAWSALGLDKRTVDVLIKATVDAQARQALDGLQPIIQGLVDQGVIDAQIALNIATLSIDDPQAALAGAQAALEDAGFEVTLPAELDTDAAERGMHGFTSRRRVATVDAEPGASVASTAGELDDVAADRTSTINTAFVQQLVQGLIIGAYLDYVARPRTVQIGVEVTGLATANSLIDNAARDRSSTITVDAVTWQLQQAIATAISNAVRLGRVAS